MLCVYSIKKAFTLIELLIVIAIIGILAGVIMVSTGSGRDKAKDAVIMTAARSLMSAAQVDGVGGSYFNWYACQIKAELDCENNFGNTSNPASAKAACKTIFKNSNYNGTQEGGALCIWSQNIDDGNYTNLQIGAWLPGMQRYYCIGSNGQTSTKELADGQGCRLDCKNGKTKWCCPGCAHDPTAAL